MIDFNIADIINLLGKSVIIQRATTTAGSYTGDTVTWATHLTITVAIQTLTGNEVLAAEKMGIKATHRMFCKVYDITEKDRVFYNSKYFKIKYVTNPMEQNSFYEILLERDDNYGSNSS